MLKHLKLIKYSMKSKDVLRILEIVDNDKEKAKEIFEMIERDQ